MTEILEAALKVASSQIPILIMGESGVGKGILAQIIHKASICGNNSMIEVNCGGFPEGIIDSELFGYKEGTFTGANKAGKVGLVEAANDSTLLLDEIGVMPSEQQIRLLKFLDDGYILPLGSTKRKRLNVRVIALTNYNLQEQLREGNFRKDLYYRLSAMPIVIPPLRVRREDINSLIETFLEYYRKKYERDMSIDQGARRYLIHYDYPGNVRELRNIIERCGLISNGEVICEEVLPPEVVLSDIRHNKMASSWTSSNSLKTLITNYENQIIEKLMNAHKSTYKVAKLLGVSQSTIVRKMNRNYPVTKLKLTVV
jgi:transcriptional regulator with PAS, ATPase and Fis domain